MDGVALVVVALLGGAVASIAPWPSIAAASSIAVLARTTRAVGWGWLLAAAACFALGAWRASSSLNAHALALQRARAELPTPARCAGTAIVTGSPVRIRGAPRWDGAARDLRCDDASSSHAAPERAWSGAVTLYGGPDDLATGDEIAVVAQLAAPERFFDEGAPDPRPIGARRASLRTGGIVDARVLHRATGPRAFIDRLRAHVRARIDATFPAEAAPMARAIVLGESDLTPEDDTAFRQSGLAHLLAVSGMHLVLVVAGAVHVLRGILTRV
jgi:competence protein ComEC